MSTSAMSTASCPHCGAPRPASAEACPRCLLQLGLHLVPRDPEPSRPASRPAPAAQAAPTPAELAAAFPGLEIEEEIGRGGMGVVFRARQRKLDRRVALKILAPELSGDPAFAERFLREARALARLSHEHIVSVYDFGETDGLCWLLMEYVDGVDLRRAMDTGELTPEQALAIVPQVCDALACAHELGIVHRDIKPENVLLDREGRAKIADFGLAKLVDPAGAGATLTGVAQAMGTPHYMAPEQMRGARDVDHRADIYSLGVVFYEMLTGRLPVGRFDPPSKRVRVDVRLDDIVLHALETEPERRYQSVTEVKTDVERVGSTPPPARATSSGSARRRAWTLRRLRIGTIGLFALAVVIAAEAWSWGWIGLAFLVLLGLTLGWVAFLTAVQSDRGARLREGMKPWRILDLWGGAALAGLMGVGLLGLSVAASWERGTPEYVAPQVPAGGRPDWSETAARQTLRLFQEVGGSELPALAEPSVNSFAQERRLVERSPRAWFLEGLAVLLLAGGVASYRWRFSCRRMQVGAVIVPVALVAMAVALGGKPYSLPFIGKRVQASAGVGGTATLEGQPQDVTTALVVELGRRGYVVHLRRDEEWVERATLDPLVRHIELWARPHSPFDRWRLTSEGPRRVDPAYRFEVLGRLGRDDSGLIWDAGLLDVDDDERREWEGDVEALLDDVRTRLEGGRSATEPLIQDADPTGTWELAFEHDNGSDPGRAVLEQAPDGTVTGALSAGPEAAVVAMRTEVEGQVRGTTLILRGTFRPAGIPTPVTLTLELAGDELSGQSVLQLPSEEQVHRVSGTRLSR